MEYSSEGIRTFLLSTRFLFQSLDRVQFYNSTGELIGDTNILDLDKSVFSRSEIIIEETIDGKQSNQFNSIDFDEENKNFLGQNLLEK